MDDTEIPQPTRGYVIAAWMIAVLLGGAGGAGVALLAQDLVIGIIAGAAAIALVGFFIVLAARRSGRGTIEGAPPWAGDAGIRHHGGGPF
jgi:tetrahydromethanopterin S-methyltransferase subunit D